MNIKQISKEVSLSYNESQHPRDKLGHWIFKNEPQQAHQIKLKIRSFKNLPKNSLQRFDAAHQIRKWRNQQKEKIERKIEHKIGRKIQAKIAANEELSRTLKRIGKSISKGQLREQGIIQPKISNKDLSKLIGSVKLQKLFRIKMATKTALKGLGGLSHNV